ncbi:hypothetical protein [Microvirga yunnanensis]|uniref:hypothetical protein n=1 Tax=Microvirga yunnanensis TaxID=2953740 RepID=UPI0021C9DABC|nr:MULTISPECIES: hypothetical protein [unclassified Microvirga]
MAEDPAGGLRTHVAAGLAIAAGLLTVLSGGMSLLVGRTTGEETAASLLFWLDLAAGFACVVTGAGLLARRAWAVWSASVIALATVAAFGALGFHILQGGAYATRTIAAMMLRTVISQVIMVAAWRDALEGGRP